jgi:hypothetical protein
MRREEKRREEKRREEKRREEKRRERERDQLLRQHEARPIICRLGLAKFAKHLRLS